MGLSALDTGWVSLLRTVRLYPSLPRANVPAGLVPAKADDNHLPLPHILCEKWTSKDHTSHTRMSSASVKGNDRGNRLNQFQTGIGFQIRPVTITLFPLKPHGTNRDKQLTQDFFMFYFIYTKQLHTFYSGNFVSNHGRVKLRKY